MHYSPAFQAQAAGELAALPPPCPADAPGPQCSALHRLVIDYGTERDRIRAARPPGGGGGAASGAP